MTAFNREEFLSLVAEASFRPRLLGDYCRLHADEIAAAFDEPRWSTRVVEHLGAIAEEQEPTPAQTPATPAEPPSSR